jgi:hypothetical protein
MPFVIFFLLLILYFFFYLPFVPCFEGPVWIRRLLFEGEDCAVWLTNLPALYFLRSPLFLLFSPSSFPLSFGAFPAETLVSRKKVVVLPSRCSPDVSAFEFSLFFRFRKLLVLR